MPDLADGESVSIQGSARLPYLLKNIGGVYSCSCPAWRNQSLPIERRTCKHLRTYCGAAAEQERLGGTPTQIALPQPANASPKSVPDFLLAQTWDNERDLAGWWLSEKLDGVRAWWDGGQFLSRQGNVYHAPSWFTAGLPASPLDGELWLARKAFQRTVSVVRRHDGCDAWRGITFVVFDAPALVEPFEARQQFLNETFEECRPPFARVLSQERCAGEKHLRQELARVEALGGEGLMLREPESQYEAGRSATLLKLKSFQEGEARVLEHLPGRGRHRGRTGALLVELPGGERFSVGSGFTDAARNTPPQLGSLITFRYQELTERGVPRFPSFVRVRDEASGPKTGPLALGGRSEPAASSRKQKTNTHTAGEGPMSPRRFVYVGGSSSKFWEVAVAGLNVSVRYGRIGTEGQGTTKVFPDQAALNRHTEKLIAQKLAKGYSEVLA